jgi:steroid delta-isomerase-like uncharacterized protein
MATASPTAPVTLDFLGEFTPRYEAAWNGRDATAMDACVTEDVHWVDPALPAPAVGRAAVRAFMQLTWRALPDVGFEAFGEPMLDPNAPRVAWAWRMTGTHLGPLDPPGFAPTGQRIEVVGMDLWVFRDGLIADYTAFYDATAIARQIGAMPPPGSRREAMVVRLQRLQARALRARAGR